MTTDHKLGKAGEKIACEYLNKNNFLIVKQNWRSGRYGEIDIIAMDKLTGELVFVEVKSRTTSTDDAKELVTRKKQQRLYKLANSYIYLHRHENVACRFDVIAVKLNEKEKEVEHIRNAFYLS